MHISILGLILLNPLLPCRPAWEVIFCFCARPSGSSSDLLKSWGGGGSVAVACGARLSCSVFMVYSVLLSVSLVAHASI